MASFSSPTTRQLVWVAGGRVGVRRGRRRTPGARVIPGFTTQSLAGCHTLAPLDVRRPSLLASAFANLPFLEVFPMRTYGWTLAIVLWSGTAAALPTLTSEDGFIFDPDASTDGGLFNGTSDAYDDYGVGCYGLTVNGTVFNAGGAHNDYYGGRGFQTLPMTICNLTIRRYGFVPAAGPSYMRFIDSVDNTGG